MSTIQQYTCDICGENFNTREEVRGDLALSWGREMIAYQNVCHLCVQSVIELISKKFPDSRAIGDLGKCVECQGTGKVTLEYPNLQVDNMIQEYTKCECQLHV